MRLLVFLLAIACSSSSGGDEVTLPCTYEPNESPGGLEEQAACAARRGDTFVISPHHLQRMQYFEPGLATVLIDGVWHYVKPSGELLAVLTYDNGADPFEEGLTRSIVDGKIAFYDVALRQVLPPKYDWAWPFQGGRALVCQGCKKGAADGDGHSPIEGGLWGYIDREGQEVVPVSYPRDELPEESAQPD